LSLHSTNFHAVGRHERRQTRDQGDGFLVNRPVTL
jgi:hypothetical protein